MLETMHYGLRLPPTISSFGHVKSVSVSHWSTLKRRRQIDEAKGDERITNFSKLESFDRRALLQRSPLIDEHDLHDLSMYAFWRLFDVEKKQVEEAPEGADRGCQRSWLAGAGPCDAP